MVNKLALTIASLAAVAVLTVALAAAGFAPGTPAPAAAVQVVQQEATPATDPAARPQVVYDDVYVQPAPSPQTIVVRVRKQTGGEHETESAEHESEGTDD